MDEQKDIFDKIMSLPILNKFYKLYTAHKEALLYLFFGGLSFLLTIATFYVFTTVFHIHNLLANIISWIIVVAFCFFTNSKFIFRATDKTKTIKRLLSFYTSRLATLVIEETILFIFIEKLDFNNMIVKTAAQIIVIILNYILSKYLIFKRSHKS